MNGDDIYDLAAAVNSRTEFVKFVSHLNENYNSHPGEWENASIRDFLSGLSGFAQDMRGYYRNMGEDVDVESVTWRMAAQMLLAAKVYQG